MKKRLSATLVLIAYTALLVKVMVFKDLPVIRIGSLMFNFGGVREGEANLVPFRTILPYLLGEKGLIIAAINLVGNVVLLVPIGFLFPFVFANMNWKKTLLLGAAAGLAIEGMQAALHVGIFDIDDIILNGVGVLVSYWVLIVFARMARSIKSSRIILAGALMILIAVGAAFYGVGFYEQRQEAVTLPAPVGYGDTDHPAPADKSEHPVPQGADPCNGTGGTGQIVGVQNNSITIERHDGVDETILLTDNTKIIIPLVLRREPI